MKMVLKTLSVGELRSPNSTARQHNRQQRKKGAVRQTSPRISSRLTAIFYEITKDRHSVRAASRLSLNVLRFESDLCELNRL